MARLDQAAAVMKAVDLLPEGLDPEVLDDAEAHLVEETARHDAKQLRWLGNHLVEVVSPEVAEAHLAKILDKQERDAAADARLVMWDDTEGRTHGKFTIPALAGAALKKALFFHTKAQRIAKLLEQATCAAQGCDCPAWMCHLHHWIAWAQGGPTNLKDAYWLCPWHHHRAHDPTFTMTKHPSGQIAFATRR